MIRDVLVMCGGRSAEHEVSIISARNILAALDQRKFRPHVVVISRSGHWYYLPNASMIAEINHCDDQLSVGNLVTLIRSNHATYLIDEHSTKQRIDLAFPILHGPMGEDGTIQGMFEVMSLPYVGCGVLSSAICMDKAFSKKLLAAAGIPIAPYVALSHTDTLPTFEAVTTKLATEVLFVKPVVMGSSVGVSKVRNQQEWETAVSNAFGFCRNIMVEVQVHGREVECAVLGNNEPKASVIGEIKPDNDKYDFYSYEAKYLDPHGAELIAPAELAPGVEAKIQAMAIKAFEVLGCAGMARVDFFLTPENEVIVNELNTIPGFTSMSMYPILWQHSGVAYTALITKLLELADEEHAIRNNVSTHRI